MSNIGELFKVLGNNPVLLGHITDGHNNNQTNSEIIDVAFSDQELMSVFTNIVDSVDTIRSKMDIVIGQKRKGMQKKTDSPVTNITMVLSEIPNEDIEVDAFYHMVHKPLNQDNVVWLNHICYLERVGMLIRLINGDIEMFY